MSRRDNFSIIVSVGLGVSGWTFAGGRVIACEKAPFLARGVSAAIAPVRHPDGRPRNDPRGGRSQEADRFEEPAVAVESPLSDQEIERLLGFIEQHFGRWHERLVDLRERDPEDFRRVLQRVAPRIQDLMSTFERNPELGALRVEEAKLKHRIYRAALRFHRSDGGARQQARQELHELFAQQFDVEQAIFLEEIKDLERRLGAQKACHNRRAQDKDAIVDKRLEQALREPPRHDHKQKEPHAPKAGDRRRGRGPH